MSDSTLKQGDRRFVEFEKRKTTEEVWKSIAGLGWLEMNLMKPVSKQFMSWGLEIVKGPWSRRGFKKRRDHEYCHLQYQRGGGNPLNRIRIKDCFQKGKTDLCFI